MIDLHCHSAVSDGTDSPAELLKKAEEAGLTALALTDHDTLDGLDEAEEAASGLSLDFVRGCEISTKTSMGSMHILGLWAPRNNPDLENFLKAARDRRDERNLRMLDKLKALGIKIEYGELKAIAQKSVGRPHFARLLVDKGYAVDYEEAFSEYLAAGAKAYSPRESASPEEAVSVLSKAGAMVFIAHPLLSKKLPRPWLAQRAAALKKRGLHGLEAWHSAQSAEERDFISSTAAGLGLAVSGGSDYHGEKKPGLSLGRACGGAPVPDRVYHNLLEYRKRKGFK